MEKDLQSVYRENVWCVYGFVAYRLDSRSDAEDLTQQTFERAIKAWGRFDPTRASAKTWLLSIARNLVIDHYRRSRTVHQQSLDNPELDEEQMPVVFMEPDLGLEHGLAQALEALSDREREIIALRYGGELSGREIADMTGLSVANVQQILSRTLKSCEPF